MVQLLAVRLEDDLHTEFKLLCVRRRQPMSAVLKTLIEDWVAAQKGEISDGQERKYDEKAPEAPDAL